MNRSKVLTAALFLSLLVVAPRLAVAFPGGPRLIVAPGFRVRVAPPPPRVEVRPLAPSLTHVWTPGYWTWQDGRHVWVAGQWAVPPQAGHAWVEARWTLEGREWVFVPGHWAPVATAPPIVVPPAPLTAPATVPGEVIVEQALPPDQVETRPPAPSPTHFWIAGHWRWEHRWVWEGGRWESQRADTIWEPAHWVRRGAAWRYIPGHWRPI